jgi:hypothetical protein
MKKGVDATMLATSHHTKIKKGFQGLSSNMQHVIGEGVQVLIKCFYLKRQKQ